MNIISSNHNKISSLGGKSVRLSDLKGKVVFLNFWATWCSFCRAETPDMVEMANQYKDQVVFLGINLTNRDNLDAIRSYIAQYKLSYPILG